MVAADVETTGVAPSTGAGCLGGGHRLSYRPAEDLTDERLAIKVSYAGWTSKPVRVVVDAVDPERPFRFLELRPFRVRRRARRSRKDTIRPAIRSASPGWTSAR
jgi:hypothetical protein